MLFFPKSRLEPLKSTYIQYTYTYIQKVFCSRHGKTPYIIAHYYNVQSPKRAFRLIFLNRYYVYSIKPYYFLLFIWLVIFLWLLKYTFFYNYFFSGNNIFTKQSITVWTSSKINHKNIIEIIKQMSIQFLIEQFFKLTTMI